MIGLLQLKRFEMLLLLFLQTFTSDLVHKLSDREFMTAQIRVSVKISFVSVKMGNLTIIVIVIMSLHFY